MSLWLSGIGVSRGIAIARVQKAHGGDLDVPEYRLAAGDVESEIARFVDAHAHAKTQLREVRGLNSVYHNNCIQTWHVNTDGSAENVEVS